MTDEKLAIEIAKAVKAKGGRAFFVGGKNRNYFIKQMGYPAEKEDKDIDIEVYFLPKEILAQILSQFGEIDYVGKSFGVFKLKHTNIDIALPRKEIQAKILHNERTIILPKQDIDEIEEIKNMYPDYKDYKIKICPEESFGHKDFLIVSDPFMSFKEAAERRDFTINAILMDALTGEIIDPFGGVEDIKKKVIRATNPKAFIEDPLRVYRAIQFAGRFGFRIDEETKSLCRQADTTTLPKERVYMEMEKLLIKSPRPSIGLRYMEELGILSQFPLLEEMVGCPQDPDHHPEGSVWEHTLMVVDEAAKQKHKSKDPISFMWAALLHDIGKPQTTSLVQGRITSYGHDKVGGELAVEFLKTLTDEKKLLSSVRTLVENHMQPILFYRAKDSIKDGAFRRLALKVDLDELALLSLCDRLGRKGVDKESELTEWRWFVDKYKSMVCKPSPIITGKLLISLGYSPGPMIGKIIKDCFEKQLDGWGEKELVDYVVQHYPLVAKSTS